MPIKAPTTRASTHYGEPNERLPLTTTLLDVAVPLYIERLKAMEPAERAATRCDWINNAEDSGVFTEVLPAGGGKPGQATVAFNGLAKALAALAFVPGGVPFGIRTYEANPDTERDGEHVPPHW